MSLTIHVIPVDRKWVVKREGSEDGGVFRTRKEAIAKARKMRKAMGPGQITVQTRSGTISMFESVGLPKRERSRVDKTSVGRREIEKAVTALVRKRLGLSNP